jgi:drug/metabolite transporter (DMT)-like permease
MKQPRIKIGTFALTGLAMAAFAANSVLCRLALSHAAIDPATFTLVRLASGACVLCLILSLRRKPKQVGGSWPASIALFAYAAGFSFAFVSLPAATGSLLLFGAVQTTMVGYGLVRGERLSALQWIGLTIAVAGLTALVAPGALVPSVTGACLMLTAGVAWGAYSLLGRGIADPLSATAGSFVRSLPIAICLSLCALLFGTHLTAGGLVFAIVSGAVASGLGYTIWYTALPGLTPAQGASVQLSVPIIAALGGTLVLGEATSLRLSISTLAILGGIALVFGGRERTLSRSS